MPIKVLVIVSVLRSRARQFESPVARYRACEWLSKSSALISQREGGFTRRMEMLTSNVGRMRARNKVIHGQNLGEGKKRGEA